MTYLEFLQAKFAFDSSSGFVVAADDIHPMLFPHQRDIVQWAVAGGRRAIFAAFGLGKSFMQLEILRLVLEREGGKGLIVCPLGVRQEFVIDAAKLGHDRPRFVRRDAEVDGPGLYVTNYESIRDGRLDPGQFAVVSLDEASILRSYGTLTTQTFLALFEQVPYRYVATATPSPNRYLELTHYAAFLGVLDRGQALTRFFQRDSTHAGNLTLYPHKEREFWLWLNTWAIFLQSPSDLGHSDDGYDLPPIEIVWHEVQPPEPTFHIERDGQGMLMHDSALGVVHASAVKRETLAERVALAAELVEDAPDEHFILWHDLEAERHAIAKAIPGAVEVYGSLDLEERERRIVDFSEGRSRILATKPILSGSGCNFQRHCHRAIYVGVGFKFNDFIQSVHRLHRFLQGEQVRIDIIYAHDEREVVAALKRKWAQHEELTERMSEIIRDYGLNTSGVLEALRRSLGVDRVEASGEDWTYVHNDCVIEAQRMGDESVGLIATSIPFANHYEYSPSYNDFGHTDDNDHFWAQMDYLTPELLRVLQPGRIAAVHVKDRIVFGNMTGDGFSTVSPFHAEAIVHYRSHGFAYMGAITILTDVVRENNQSYRLGWSEHAKDGTKMGVGSPEYLLIFRKRQTDRSKGYADVPVTHPKDQYSRARWQTDADAFWRSSGDRMLNPDELARLGPDKVMKLFTEWSLANVYDHETVVRIGEALDARGVLPSTFKTLALGSHSERVWADVNRMWTLNSEQARKNLQLHVCPLSFDVVDRAIERWSNLGDVVFDPFGGIGTVPVRAVKAGRQGYGCELAGDYWVDGVKHLEAEAARHNIPSLFDVFAEEQEAS